MLIVSGCWRTASGWPIALCSSCASAMAFAVRVPGAVGCVQGDWQRFLLRPYDADVDGPGDADMFAWTASRRWVKGAPGWEASNCFLALGQYPAGWRARGENATNLQVGVGG